MKILVAPLHWGLGHVSRCIPIIQRLLAEKNEVILASDGAALLLLQKEFPQLKSVTLPAYNILYPTSNMLWNMAIQSQKFFKAIQAEYIDTQSIVKEYEIDEIISDNRFGCYSPLVKKNIFITHQINLLTPFGLFDSPARWLNHRFMKKFDEIWIPDEENESISLAGKLAHGHLGNLPSVKYIGAQTRMKKEMPNTDFSFFEKMPISEKKVAVVLSGPEPQRTFLEEKILMQAQKMSHNFLIIRGLANDETKVFLKENIKMIGYLTSEDLNSVLLEADFVISRSGYSTIMDLAVLDKKALLIPTPGQTEQEYLAKYFSKKGIWKMQTQENLSLKEMFL